MLRIADDGHVGGDRSVGDVTRLRTEETDQLKTGPRDRTERSDLCLPGPPSPKPEESKTACAAGGSNPPYRLTKPVRIETVVATTTRTDGYRVDNRRNHGTALTEAH